MADMMTPILAADTTPIGWTVTAVFGLAALAVLASVWPNGFKCRTPADRYWLVLGLVVAFLAINKQLDLQTVVIEAGRDIAKSAGVYEMKRTIQVIAAIVIVAVMTAGGFFLFRFLQRVDRAAWLALAGLALVGCYIVGRSSMFLKLIERAPGWLPLLELAGAVVVFVACVIRLRRVNTDRGESAPPC